MRAAPRDSDYDDVCFKGMEWFDTLAGDLIAKTNLNSCPAQTAFSKKIWHMKIS